MFCQHEATLDAHIIRLTVESGVWHCSTLVAVSQRAALFEILYENGLTHIVSETDSGIAYIHPGSSLHEEFLRLHAAGLPPYEVLLTTIRNAAEILDYEKRLGTIEVGKDANLVLLDENPLENIANTNTIAGVMIKGIWLSGGQLQDMLEEYSQREDED